MRRTARSQPDLSKSHHARQASESERYFDDFFGSVGSLLGVGVEHVETIVRYFNTDPDGFMAERRRWLQNRGASVVTVLAEAQCEAEAQRPRLAAERQVARPRASPVLLLSTIQAQYNEGAI
jgi:hypothetical protein